MEASLNAMQKTSQKAPHTADSFRTCIASGQRKLKIEMLRFVIGPDDCAVPDLDEKLPGRGLWLIPEREFIDAACVQNLFAKKARCHVISKFDLAQRVEELLVRRCIELLQLARRSCVLTAGSDEVRRRLLLGAKGLLVLAADCAPKNFSKITNMARHLSVRSSLTGRELGTVLGRERVVNAFVEEGGLANRLALK